MNTAAKLPENSLFPSRTRLLSANLLRILAIVFMLCDHLWARVLSGNMWMSYVGRLAFPIFAFQIAEGFIHTSNFKKYALRLLAFALASELPFNLFYSSSLIYPFHQNVLFTLLIGLVAIKLIDNMKKEHSFKAILKNGLLLLLMAILSVITFPDYGFLGVLTVVMFYLVRDFPFAPVFQVIAMLLIHAMLFEGEMISFELFGRHFELAKQGFAVFSLIPIWLYSGKNGKRNVYIKYAFYIVYPLHMLLIWLLLRL